MICSTLFILTIVSWSKLWLKIFCQTYPGLRVMSMGIEFCQNPELTCKCSWSSSSFIFDRFSLKFQYVIAETICFFKCAIYFLIRSRDHAENFDWKSKFGLDFEGFWFLCIKSMGAFLARSVRHLPCNLRVVGSSPVAA